MSYVLAQQCACGAELPVIPDEVRDADDWDVFARYRCGLCARSWWTSWSVGTALVPVVVTEAIISACPVCGYPDCRDLGPYGYQPEWDNALGGPPDPRVHLLTCGRCGKDFDAATDDYFAEIRQWARARGYLLGEDGEIPDDVLELWQYRSTS